MSTRIKLATKRSCESSSFAAPEDQIPFLWLVAGIILHNCVNCQARPSLWIEMAWNDLHIRLRSAWGCSCTFVAIPPNPIFVQAYHDMVLPDRIFY